MKYWNCKLSQHQFPGNGTVPVGDFYKVKAFWEFAQIKGFVIIDLV